MKKIAPLLIFTFLIIACSKSGSDSIHYEMATVENEEVLSEAQSIDPGNNPATPLTPIENTEVIKKKIIKDGRMVVSVQELEKTKSQIDSLLKKYDGYYASENLSNSDWSSSYILKIRIPGMNFENLIKGIESGDGKIEHKEIDARDVTDQFIDLETRLQNKKSYLERYKDILKQAKSIKEILEVEEIIRRMEEEIESTTGRLRYLSDQVSYSTLDLTITKEREFKYNPSKRDNFTESLKQSLSKGWFGFIDFFLLFIKIWPLWIIAGIVIYFWRRNRIKKKE